MANILISLLGDQTVPIVFLMQDEQFSHIDYYIFVTTEEMEQKNRLGQILDATQLEDGKYESIKVPPEYPSMLIQVLEEELTLDPEDHYYVNLTGGTKMMSVGLYQFFIQHSSTIKAEMFYKPIRKNAFIRLYPEQKQEELRLTYQISIENYLKSNGVQLTKKKSALAFSHPMAYTLSIFEYLIDEAFANKFRSATSQLRQVLNNKKRAEQRINITFIEACLQHINYPIVRYDALERKDLLYLTGLWLEEFVFIKLANQLALGADYLQRNVQIQRANSSQNPVSNEFDVIFVKDNTLHIIECKTSIGHKQIDSTLYKLQALRQEMGLRVNAYLFTPSFLEKEMKKRLAKKANLYNIKIFDKKDFLNDFADFHP